MGSGKIMHIVMFPWLAFGHLLPFLNLAMLIAKRGHKVSFLSTPRNIYRLPKIPSELKPLIEFVRIALPPVDGLPVHAESTSDVPFDKVKFLKIAYDGIRNPVTLFVESMLPDWILCDFASYWLGPLAYNLGIRFGWYCIFPASLLGFLGPPGNMVDFGEGGGDGDGYRVKTEDYTVKPKWVQFETSVAMTLFQILAMAPNLEDDETENVSDLYRVGMTVEYCDMVAIRSGVEFEPEWLNLVEEIYGKPVVPVGFLPSSDSFGDDECWGHIKDWLDKQADGSVIYVAFGTETKLNQVQVTELALGLELSGLPFFWAFRKQRGSDDPEIVELPEGFEERNRDRGMVYTTWVPQNKILSHGSVGGLLFHAGWSSVVEALQFGKVMVLLPMLGDQGIIARQLEEKKLGFAIPRNEQDGWFTRESVAESLKLVMVDEEAGKIYRDKVKEMQSVFGDMDKQDCYVDNFIAYLDTNKLQVTELSK